MRHLYLLSQFRLSPIKTTAYLALLILFRLEPEEGDFEVFLATLRNTTVTIRIKASTTIKQLKQKIFDLEGVEPDSQRLIFGTKQLEDEKNGKEMTAADYGMSPTGTSVHMVLRLPGGNH